MLPVEVVGDESIPKSQTFETIVDIKFHVPILSGISIPVSGCLVDIVKPLDLPPVADFENIFVNMKGQSEIVVNNPSRRKIAFKFYVDKDYQDIFWTESTQDFILPKKSVTIKLFFCPKSAVNYQTQAFMETENGNSSMTLRGRGLEPKIEITNYAGDFGVVGVGCDEFRQFSLFNMTPLPMTLRFKTTNQSFRVVPCEIRLEAEQTIMVPVQFKAPSKECKEHCNLQIFMLEDTEESEQAAQQVEFSMKKDFSFLKELPFNAQGGFLGMVANGIKLSSSTEDLTDENKKIVLNYPKVSLRQTTKKTINIENTGNVPLDLIVKDMSGQELPNKFKGVNDHFTIALSVASLSIPALSKPSIIVSVEGFNIGPDEIVFQLVTQRLVDPMAYIIEITGQVIDAVDESLKAFVRSDQSLETMLSLAHQEESMVQTDQNLWKLMLPVIRISHKLPSQELKHIPLIEPNVNRPEIGPFLVRPPALPVTLPPRNKKWYMNRVSMTTNKTAVFFINFRIPKWKNQTKKSLAKYKKPLSSFNRSRELLLWKSDVLINIYFLFLDAPFIH